MIFWFSGTGNSKYAAQRIAERMTVAALERFERNNSAVGILLVDLDLDRRRLQKSSVSHVIKFPINTLGSLHR